VSVSVTGSVSIQAWAGPETATAAAPATGDEPAEGAGDVHVSVSLVLPGTGRATIDPER